MAWRYDLPKCPVSPADRGEYMKPSTPSASAGPQAEAVAWQWRCKVADDWTGWHNIEGSVENFKRRYAENLESGTTEFRPVYAHPQPQQADGGDECFDMLWEWFTQRRGAEDMRANAADGGLSADDFKQMLDEHEANLIPQQSPDGPAK